MSGKGKMPTPTGTPQLALPAPNVSPLLPTSLHMMNMCIKHPLWACGWQSSNSCPLLLHTNWSLYILDQPFFPIRLWVSFFLSGFGALFLHAEKMLWVFLKWLLSRTHHYWIFTSFKASDKAHETATSCSNLLGTYHTPYEVLQSKGMQSC